MNSSVLEVRVYVKNLCTKDERILALLVSFITQLYLIISLIQMQLTRTSTGSSNILLKFDGQCDPRGPFWRAPVIALAVVYVAGLVAIGGVRVLRFLRRRRSRTSRSDSMTDRMNKRTRGAEAEMSNGEAGEGARESLELESGLIMMREGISDSPYSQQSR